MIGVEFESMTASSGVAALDLLPTGQCGGLLLADQPEATNAAPGDDKSFVPLLFVPSALDQTFDFATLHYDQLLRRLAD